MRLQRNPDNRISVEQARVQLKLLLTSATDERVAGYTVDLLARMHRVKPREIETMLSAEQAKRRRMAAERPAQSTEGERR